MRRYEADALVDTGAIRSVIPSHVQQSLGLQIRGQRVAEYADGRHETVGITEPLILDILGRDTLEEALVLGDEVLVGQTVLEKLDLLADCANGRCLAAIRRIPTNPSRRSSSFSRIAAGYRRDSLHRPCADSAFVRYVLDGADLVHFSAHRQLILESSIAAILCWDPHFGPQRRLSRQSL